MVSEKTNDTQLNNLTPFSTFGNQNSYNNFEHGKMQEEEKKPNFFRRPTVTQTNNCENFAVFMPTLNRNNFDSEMSQNRLRDTKIKNIKYPKNFKKMEDTQTLDSEELSDSKFIVSNLNLKNSGNYFFYKSYFFYVI